MAALFNNTPVNNIDVYKWIITDPSAETFSNVVDKAMIEQRVTLGNSGLMQWNRQEIYVKRIAVSEKESFLKKADASRNDMCILGNHINNQGKRFLDFKSYMVLLKEDTMTDWPLQGPRLTLKFLKNVRSGPGDLATYHLSWAKGSGINIYSMVRHNHRIICNVVRTAMETDQLNGTNVLAVELLLRRLVRIKTAESRLPSSPDFPGLELVLEDPIGTGGEAAAAIFNNWLVGKLKECTNIVK